MNYKYKITGNYCWYDRESYSKIVKMYFINGMPFTFDELEDGQLYDQDIIKEASEFNISYNEEILYKCSFYLMDEQMHPMLFPVALENPEDMPDDMDYIFEEDLTN
tara:strand:- start:14718 stop:15035 length:318 start_codon:yes stop_codon:yes gene_type:complete